MVRSNKWVKRLALIAAGATVLQATTCSASSLFMTFVVPVLFQIGTEIILGLVDGALYGTPTEVVVL